MGYHWKAVQVIEGKLTCVVAASKDMELAADVQSLFAQGNMRINLSRDVAGVEVCSALKNVLAIAAGIVEGKQLGSNALAAVVRCSYSSLFSCCVCVGTVLSVKELCVPGCARVVALQPGLLMKALICCRIVLQMDLFCQHANVPGIHNTTYMFLPDCLTGVTELACRQLLSTCCRSLKAVRRLDGLRPRWVPDQRQWQDCQGLQTSCSRAMERCHATAR